MKKSLLPRMQKLKMLDKEGKEFLMEIELRQNEQLTYVFLSDTHQLGASRLAQNAMYYLEKLVSKLNLDRDRTHFYRHIYQEQMGSLFGRFQVDWKAKSGPSYRFHMLTNIDDLQSIERILKTSTAVRLEELRQRQAS